MSSLGFQWTSRCASSLFPLPPPLCNTSLGVETDSLINDSPSPPSPDSSEDRSLLGPPLRPLETLSLHLPTTSPTSSPLSLAFKLFTTRLSLSAL